MLPQRQQILIGQLDKLVTDLQAHEQEIYQKLVSILRERLDFYCRNLAEEAWNDACSDSASPYMRGLVKELQALVRVLSGALPVSAVQAILTRIAQTAAQRLVEHYSKLPLTTSVSQHRLHQDITFFTTALRGFEGIVVSDEDVAVLLQFCGDLPAFREK